MFYATLRWDVDPSTAVSPQITRDPVRDAAVEASRAVTRRHGAVERSRSGEAKKSDSCIYSLANII